MKTRNIVEPPFRQMTFGMLYIFVIYYQLAKVADII